MQPWLDQVGSQLLTVSDYSKKKREKFGGGPTSRLSNGSDIMMRRDVVEL